MKLSIEAKDAPATCLYLGQAQGYMLAHEDMGNINASRFYTQFREAEGKCGVKNALDLKTTFTDEEWKQLAALQKKIESSEL